MYIIWANAPVLKDEKRACHFLYCSFGLKG